MSGDQCERGGKRKKSNHQYEGLLASEPGLGKRYFSWFRWRQVLIYKTWERPYRELEIRVNKLPVLFFSVIREIWRRGLIKQLSHTCLQRVKCDIFHCQGLVGLWGISKSSLNHCIRPVLWNERMVEIKVNAEKGYKIKKWNWDRKFRESSPTIRIEGEKRKGRTLRRNHGEILSGFRQHKEMWYHSKMLRVGAKR